MKASNALTVPNLITTIRILMAVVASVLFAASYMERAAVVLCVSAALLDAFDGWCARLFSQCSKLGKLLDPLADKLIITVMYAVIAIRTQSALIWILFILILLREIAITLLRDFALRRRNVLIASSRLGKVKMAVQSLLGSLIIIYGYFFTDEFDIPVYLIASAMMLILAVTYFSAYQYISFWKAAPHSTTRSPRVDIKECFRKEKRMVAGK